MAGETEEKDLLKVLQEGH